MKKLTVIIFSIFLVATTATAQDLISSGTVEYEVKTNLFKTMGDDSWAEQMKDNMSKFKTGYFKLSFTEKESLYKFDRWDPNQKIMSWFLTDDENAKWYFNHDNSSYSVQKSTFGFNYLIKDSIPKIKWKLENETQTIAGYSCRKATGIMMDSVYIFAFYTDQIMAPSGPASINGLPGTILAMTIPRLYSSFIATKVTPNTVAEIKPLTAKKTYNSKEILDVLKERMKEWYSGEDDSANDMQRMLWNAML